MFGFNKLFGEKKQKERPRPEKKRGGMDPRVARRSGAPFVVEVNERKEKENQ